MRRIAFVLAGVTAAGFLAVTPAVADDGPSASHTSISGERFEQERGDGYESYNIGGRHGLTAATGGESRTSAGSFDVSHSMADTH